jgi:hypothetical protein
MRVQLQEQEKEGYQNIQMFNNYAEDFYDTCIEYIPEWCLPFLMPLQPRDWINLKGHETWNSVQYWKRRMEKTLKILLKSCVKCWLISQRGT